MNFQAKPSDNLKKIFLPVFPYGPAVFEHLLLTQDLNANMKVGRDFKLEDHSQQLLSVFQHCTSFVNSIESQGYIIQKKELRPSTQGRKYQKYYKLKYSISIYYCTTKTFVFINLATSEGGKEEEEEFITYIEFHPYLLKQIENKSYQGFPSFDTAIDEYFSKQESQKIELKVVQQEKLALKKLENVKKDHSNR